MNDASMRRLVEGMLTLLLTALATWLAAYLTRRLLGPEPEEEE